MTSSVRDLIAGAIAEVLSGSPDNRLDDFGGQRVFDSPLVGMADGDDPVFEVLRTAVSPSHLMPREILRAYAAAGGEPAGVSVVSWALPFTEEIRLSNRNREWPSELYSVARNNGGALLHEIGRRLPGILSERGIASVVPAETPEYDAFRDPGRTFSSTWSNGVAYAAGFAAWLNGALITAEERTFAGDIVTNLPPEAGLRNGGSSGPVPERRLRVWLCVARCPILAIGGEGLDKSRCNDRRKAIRAKSLDAYLRTYHLTASPVVKSGHRDPGYSLGCAVCQAGVPCEDRDPFQGQRE
jgi:hypothetical protein